MAIFFDAPVDPDALTTYIREIPVDSALTWMNEFPVRTTNRNEVDWAEINRTHRVAKFRAYDGRISVSRRDTGASSQMRLAPLSTSLNMGEYERLQLEFARTGGTNTEALADAVYNDADQLVGEVHNRLELAWGDVLTDFKLSIDENDLVTEADFGAPAGHTPTAGTAWTNLAAPALTNLIAWHDQYKTSNNGAPAGQIRTTQANVRLMTRNTEIINAVHGASASATRVTLQELNDLLTSEGLPPVSSNTIDGTLDVDGDITRVIPDDRLLMLPASLADLGYVSSGITATALELVNSNEAELDFADAPGIVGVVEKVGPPYRQFTFVDAVALPVLAEPRRLLVAKVK